jgi:bifunctional non-homologous end joining protein LigD
MNENEENAMLAFSDLATGGTSDKVYVVNLKKSGDGYTVVAQYGRRGGALATDDKTKNGPLGYEAAKKLFDKTVAGKVAKGYERSVADAPAAQVAPPKTVGAVAQHRPQELLEEVDEAYAMALLVNPDYWMQDKSDGHSRGVVKNADGSMYGLNKLGKRVPLPFELHSELSRIPLSTFHIDAELVGDRLVCRDLLDADGDIHGLPYEERFKRLVKATFGLDDVVPVRTWQNPHKRAAFDQQRKENREGVVFKLIDAPHRAGRNGQHKKFKFVKTLSAIAGKPRATGKDSVEIFLVDGNDKKRVGTVSLIGKPEVKEGDVIEVAYLYAFPSKMLSQARLLRVRDDVTPGECSTKQLVFKRE